MDNVNLYKTIYNELKEKEKQLESIKNDFINQLHAEGIEEKTVGNGKAIVSYKNQPSKTFNQSSFAMAYPELKEQFTELKDKYYFKVK